MQSEFVTISLNILQSYQNKDDFSFSLGEFMAMIGVNVQEDIKDDDQDAAMKRAILAVMEARRQKRKQGAARRKPGIKGNGPHRFCVSLEFLLFIIITCYNDQKR